jgi:hypothetical protein
MHVTKKDIIQSKKQELQRNRSYFEGILFKQFIGANSIKLII